MSLKCSSAHSFLCLDNISLHPHLSSRRCILLDYHRTWQPWMEIKCKKKKNLSSFSHLIVMILLHRQQNQAAFSMITSHLLTVCMWFFSVIAFEWHLSSLNSTSIAMTQHSDMPFHYKIPCAHFDSYFSIPNPDKSYFASCLDKMSLPWIYHIN